MFGAISTFRAWHLGSLRTYSYSVLRLAPCLKPPSRSSALRMAKEIVANVSKAGISPQDIAQMTCSMKHLPASFCDGTDNPQGFNERIIEILSKASHNFYLQRLQHCSRGIEAVLSVLVDFGLSEPMARDILHNNPLLLVLSVEDVTEVCRELHMSGVNPGDFASILSQHSIRCNAR